MTTIPDIPIDTIKLHKVIDKLDAGVGNASALTFLWVMSKYPDGVTSGDVANGRGVTMATASRWLKILAEDQFLIESGRENRSILYTINWERL